MSETITVTVVDSATDGFNIGEDAMNTLTCVDSRSLSLFSQSRLLTCACSNNQAAFLGVVDATGVQVDESYCGLA